MSDHEARARKLAERIQVIVAETIERRIKDPRMGFVTITDVRVTGDLREATVFYTVLDSVGAPTRDVGAFGAADGNGDARSDLHPGPVPAVGPNTLGGLSTVHQDTAAALESAKGMLRTEVGRQTGIRHTPSLTFIADAIPETARHIDDLLRQAHHADEQVHERAASAKYAGDPDPYRHDDELELDDVDVHQHEESGSGNATTGSAVQDPTA
jgi:ribosome-binding factor A